MISNLALVYINLSGIVEASPGVLSCSTLDEEPKVNFPPKEINEKRPNRSFQSRVAATMTHTPRAPKPRHDGDGPRRGEATMRMRLRS